MGRGRKFVSFLGTLVMVAKFLQNFAENENTKTFVLSL